MDALGTTGLHRRVFPPGGRRPHRGKGWEGTHKAADKAATYGERVEGGTSLSPAFTPSRPRCGGLGLAGNDSVLAARRAPRAVIQRSDRRERSR